MIAVTAFLYALIWDHQLTRADGFILLIVLGIYILFVNRAASEEPREVLGEYEKFARSERHLNRVTARDVSLIVFGSMGLVVGGTLIVHSAEFIADTVGVPDRLIGLTVVAIGTSLPELATSLVAAVRHEADIAVGNIVGSNIFNVAAILGATAAVTNVPVEPSILTRELPAVLILSVLVLPLARNGFAVRRWEGAVLLTGYVVLGTILFRF